MDFAGFLKTEKTILFDGAMGTQLARKGLDLSGAMNNLIHPEMVLQVHQEYLKSGAQVLIANTFAMNPIYMMTHNLDRDLEEVNRRGVELARQAAGDHAFVLGDMGPTGQMMEPFGTYSEQDFIDCFKKQAQVLAGNGVDGFIIETMFDLREALCALRACQETSSVLPVIVSFALSQASGHTMMGQTLTECAVEVEKAGAIAVGTNCGDLDPEEIATIVAGLQTASTLRIIVQPNAGKPKLVQGKTVYDMLPEDFAAGVKKCIDAGASLVGGCCGTMPEHISAVSRLL